MSLPAWPRSPASDEMIKKAMASLDRDGDGKVSLDEFKAIAWKKEMQVGDEGGPTKQEVRRASV